jgi:hypothetical protein
MPTTTRPTLRVKQHDLYPPLRAQLLDGTTPVNLTPASNVRVIVTSTDRATELIDRAMTVTDPTGGWVEMEWVTGDTATIGRFLLEIEVTWPTSRPQTFPVNGYAWLVIVDDLG